VIGAERNYRGDVVRLKAIHLRQNKPPTAADEIAVKLVVDVPDDAFNPFEVPEIKIELTPAELKAWFDKSPAATP
jgi:hypothetical protein